eukprot:359586-Chlamydomonas_euryale.AAC.13
MAAAAADVGLGSRCNGLKAARWDEGSYGRGPGQLDMGRGGGGHACGRCCADPCARLWSSGSRRRPRLRRSACGRPSNRRGARSARGPCCQVAGGAFASGGVLLSAHEAVATALRGTVGTRRTRMISG